MIASRIYGFEAGGPRGPQHHLEPWSQRAYLLVAGPLWERGHVLRVMGREVAEAMAGGEAWHCYAGCTFEARDGTRVIVPAEWPGEVGR